MRKSTLFIAVLLIAFQFVIVALPVSASDGDVKKGTPVVDGVLDENYLQSYSYKITTENPVYNAGVEYTDAADTTATSYFLWDDKYIYVCTVVTDSTLLSVGKDVLDAADYTWQNDVCEMWWNVDGTQYLVNLDAFGLRMTGSPTVTGSEGYVAKSTMDKNSYIVEFAYPYSNKAANTFNYSTQINNILAEDASKIICIGAQKAVYQFTLSSTEVTYPEPEKEATEIPITEATVEVATADETESAQTADIAVITSVITLAVSAFVILKSKKK